VFRDLVSARIIEPTSNIAASRVLSEVGVEAASYATLKRRLPMPPFPGGANPWPRHAPPTPGWGPTSLVLFDVSTLYLETDAGDGFREPGLSIYAEVAVMPMPWWRWCCSCCSARLAGVTRAA